MNKLKTFFFFSFLFCCFVNTFAQNTISIDHITEDNGLSYRWVWDITQDHNGFIWFATWDGLNRYDGINFKTYKHSESDNNSISDSKVSRVTKDHQGNIWIYGHDQVFNKIDLSSGKVTKTKSRYKNGVIQTGNISNMKHFSSLRNGDFIVMFQDKDLNKCSFWKYIPKKNAFDHLIDVPTEYGIVNNFTERIDGKIWLWGMGIGYYLIDLSNSAIKYYPVDNIGLQTFLKVQLPIDKNGDFWYPADSSVDSLKIENTDLKKFQIPIDLDVSKISSIRLDNLGGIWFKYDQDKLYHFDTKTELLEKFTAPIFGKTQEINSMYRFFVDDEGAYWHGIFYGALRFTNKHILFNKYLSQSIPEDNLSIRKLSTREIIELSPNTVLLKNINHDLFIIDLSTEKIKKLNRSPESTSAKIISKEINSIVMSKDGYLWTNQDNKLVKTNLETGLYQSFDGIDYVSHSESSSNYEQPRIFEDASGNLWWCSKSGLYIFDRLTEKMKPIKVNHPVSSVNGPFDYASYDSDEDAIYGIYDGGIYIIDCKNQSSSLLKIFSEQKIDFLTTAILKWKNEFWLSTNKGLIRYNPETKEQNIYTKKDGLPSDIIYSTLGAKNNLWMATHNGLCQFNPSNMKITTYYKKQGLPHNEFNRWSYLQTKDGHMFFGGLNGIIGFDPNAFDIPDKKLGQLHLVEFSKYDQKKDTLITTENRSLSKTDKITILPTEKNISFKYVLTLFDEVKKNQYFHYMDGLEPKWRDNGNQNEARYSQIPPGNYTFRVKATGPNKIAALNEISIPIAVKQYWYKRWWAITAYIFLLASGIGILYRFQLNQKLDKQEANRIRELNQLKTKMYTNITHEFRTPLTVMLGMNNAIKDYTNEGEIDKVYHANEMIDRNGKNLLNLVNQMLELSKLEAGLLEVNNQQSNIVDYLKYRMESFQSYGEAKNIQIHFHPDEDPIMMDFDVDKISYIIGNLISNAIKFTPIKGNIYVYVSNTLGSDNESYLELKVKDTGIGIKADKIDRIFDRFYQVDDSNIRKGEGTGIGLSLVKELVKLLKGTINVKSKVDEGTEFSVLLPITTNAETAKTKLSQSTSNEWSESIYSLIDDDKVYITGNQNSPLVLIVEDNADVSHYIRVSIKDEYRTISADNGNDGIEKAIELVPDIIISDVMMPGKDGFELCESIKKDERTSHIPVILLTGKADVDSKIQGLEHGADVYLSKPFNRKELLLRLKNLMALRAEIQKHYSETDFTQPVSGLSNIENAFLLKIRTIILEHIEDEDFSIAQLCGLIHLSRAQLHRKFIALTGESTSNFIRKVQLEKAKELLSLGELNVSEVAFMVGFKTQAHFSRVFSEAFGKPPSNYLK